MVYDVLIIGAGPAAFATATFLVRAGFSVLVIGQDENSGLVDAASVENYPGFPDGIAGRVLLDQMIEQSKKQGAKFEHQEVTHVEQMSENEVANGKFLVKTATLQEFRGKNMILAHGANYIKANLPGEKEYVGKGVAYCSLCDGPLFKNKKVLVLGNANLAAEEALELSAYVREVKIISHATAVNFSDAYKKLLDEKKIAVLEDRVKAIEGDGAKVTSVVLASGAKEDVEGVFIALGIASSTTFAQKLGLQMNGDFISVDANMRTSVPGVWAVGLARGGVNQLVKSVGDSGVAAVDIIKTVKGLPSYIDHT